MAFGSRVGRIGVLVVLAVLVAGCGTRVKDETTAQGDGLGNTANASANAPAGSSNGTGAGATGSGAPMFGTVESPCGPNAAGGTLSATATGVTADAITITTISDPGGAKAGLNQSVFDAMTAFASWCNDQGGINGRKLEVELRDAKLIQYKERVVDACQDSFALVGGIGVFDDTGVQDSIDCGLINIPAATVGARATEAPNMVQPLPSSSTVYSIGPSNWIKQNFPDAPKAAATAYSKVPQVDYQNKRMVSAYTQNGFTFSDRKATNVNESNWGPTIVQLKGEGAKYLSLTSSFEEILPMLKEMNAQNFRPDVFELETNFYDRQLPSQIKQQGIDPGSMYVRLTMFPFEDAASNPAMQTYLDEVAKASGSPAALGVQAWSAGLLFATAAKKAGANLTRESLMAALKEIKSWDGGGLHGPTDPAGRGSQSCFVMLKVVVPENEEDSGFERAYPLPDKDKAVYENDKRTGMACPDDGLMTLKDPPKAE